MIASEQQCGHGGSFWLLRRCCSCFTKSSRGPKSFFNYDPYWNGAHGFSLAPPAPWSAPLVRLISLSRARLSLQVLAIIETAMVLGKFFVFLAFARLKPAVSDQWAA